MQTVEQAPGTVGPDDNDDAPGITEPTAMLIMFWMMLLVLTGKGSGSRGGSSINPNPPPPGPPPDIDMWI